MQTEALSVSGAPRLFVDLDGSLLCGDILQESIIVLLRRNPLHLFSLLWWWMGGKARLKHEIARRVDLAVQALPWNQAVLDFLVAEKQRGRSLVLATASHEKYAHAIDSELRLFDQVLASDAQCNLNGRRKLATIESLSQGQPFAYMGNAGIDLPIWAAAQQAYVVSNSQRLRRRAAQQGRVEKEFSVPGNRIWAMIRALRLHQWLKNLLVLVPLFASHQLNSSDLVLTGVLAFLAFGLTASAGYLLNDLLDLDSDRQHPNKRRRPLASGELPIAWGAAAIPLLLLAAVGVSSLLPAAFAAVLLLYFLSSLSYSLWLKRIMMLDVTVLSLLYTLRILAGAAATGITPSFWLLAFSLFLFLSLAILKRYAELWLLSQQADGEVQGRGYQTSDLGLLGMLGTSSGFLSTLVLALYINSTDVTALYSHPERIWFVCPIMLYWTGRIWFKAHRGQMHDDPVVFAARDPVSWLVLLLAGGVLLLAV